MFDFVVDSLFDFCLCRGNFEKWLIARLLNIAEIVCLCVTGVGFEIGWYILGIIGAVGTVYFFILDCKFIDKLTRERR